MDYRRGDRSEAQAVETVLAFAIGVAVFIAVLIGSALLVRAVGAERFTWIGPAMIVGSCAGVAAAGWWLFRARRQGL